MKILRFLFRQFVATFGLNDKVVCEESAALGLVDFHDYTDSIEDQPWHFYTHTCKRCGKHFTI